MLMVQMTLFSTAKLLIYLHRFPWLGYSYVAFPSLYLFRWSRLIASTCLPNCLSMSARLGGAWIMHQEIKGHSHWFTILRRSTERSDIVRSSHAQWRIWFSMYYIFLLAGHQNAIWTRFEPHEPLSIISGSQAASISWNRKWSIQSQEPDQNRYQRHDKNNGRPMLLKVKYCL